MADRTVSVVLQARITDYMAKMSAASKATTDFANKVSVAKGRAAQGYHEIGVAGVAVGAVVAGGFALAIKSAADFQSKVALVATLSHAGAGQVKQLSDAALHVGQRFGYTASQVADAEAELVKAGVSVTDIMGGALTGALTLASAGQTDVATATTIAATAMTQFGLAGKDVPHIADLLASGADKALGSVSDLGFALDQAGPTAHQFGLSIEETVGTLAAFAQAGQIGERGGTILTQMLLKMAAPSKAASGILDQLGISLYNTQGQFVGMSNLAGQLQTKLSGLTLAERNHDLAVIFGQRAIRGASILYQDGAKGIADWTSKVNDSGFATLQATGKLNSLSGDLTKLKAALQTAFIGAGESGQGPLRSMTQNITKAIDVWNGLPGPVRGAAEALTAAAGTVALAGGAALLFIPKWEAMNAALAGSSVGAISASRAFGLLGKAVAAVALVQAADFGISQLQKIDPIAAKSPDVQKLALSLETLGRSGLSTGKTLDVFGPKLSKFSDELNQVLHPSTMTGLFDKISHIPVIGLGAKVAGLAGTNVDFDQAKKNINSLDDALTELVNTNQLPLAQQAFSQLSATWVKSGHSADDLAKGLPHFSTAIYASSVAAGTASSTTGGLADQMNALSKKTHTAAQATQDYATKLHALADPLFAMNQALQGVTDAQGAAAVAIHKYGRDSAQARQANLDLASAALTAETAARTLAKSVKNGSVSIGDARKFLHAWVTDGLLTKAQAQSVSDSFDHLIGRAQTIAGLHPNVTVTADTTQAESALTGLNGAISNAISGFLNLGQVSGGRAIGGSPDLVGLKAPLGALPPASNPKTTRKPAAPTTSDAGYTVPYDSGSAGSAGGSSGGSGAGSAGTKQRPPTVQEIVQAILHGTIPPSIDKLSKILQKEIGHLSTVVGNAEQYRSTIRSGLRGYAGLANMGTATAGTDILGASGPASRPNVDAYLKGRAHKLQQFAHLLNRLDKAGVDQDLLSQFAQVGPDAIPAMQQLLSTGKHGIHRANRYETEIRHYAGAAANTAVNDKYATQLIRSVDKLPEKIQRAVIKGMRGANFKVGWHEGDRKGGHKVLTHA